VQLVSPINLRPQFSFQASSSCNFSLILIVHKILPAHITAPPNCSPHPPPLYTLRIFSGLIAGRRQTETCQSVCCPFGKHVGIFHVLSGQQLCRLLPTYTARA
jgi:hypothetical protein